MIPVKSWLLTLGMLFASFAGGAAWQWLAGPALATAQDADTVSNTPDELRVHNLLIVDEEGRVRAQIGVAPDGSAGFVIKDTAGTDRILLGGTPDETDWSVSVHDAAGQHGASMGVSSVEGVGVSLMMPGGKTEFSFGVTPDGKGTGLELTDQNGTGRITLGTGTEWTGIAMKDQNDMLRTATGMGADDKPYSMYYDADGDLQWSIP